MRSGDIYRLAPTFIRVDVSHFMAICCRFKCFSEDNYAVKNFLIRVVALLVSCDNFERFDHTLTLILTVMSNSYDSAILNGILSSCFLHPTKEIGKRVSIVVWCYDSVSQLQCNLSKECSLRRTL